MSGPSDFQPTNPALKWIERRLPIMGLMHSSFVAYPTPRNLNYWWTFGAILSLMLGVQILTGVILAMHYTPHADMAFKSVELIVRDVNYGWLLRYGHANGFLFLGRGAQYPIALEGALKLKEISYIHAEGYAAGEMKHGPIALIDDQLPVVVLVPKGPSYEKTVSNLAEVRARQGKVLAVATRGDNDIGSHADDVVLVPDTALELQPILTVLPLQMLSYYVADQKGTDVDQPRNLAKSVTVE